MWQHLFWFFGHPEVYIIFIPATGVVSEMIPAFARRPIFGYPAVVLSLVATSFLGFGLWVHHMFATGIAQLGASFFTGGEHDDRDPERGADLLLDRDAVGRPPDNADAAAFRDRLLSSSSCSAG